MWKWYCIALFTLCLLPRTSAAVEIKNVRPGYGPVGALRTDTTCIPGDVLFMTYDIDGLKTDAKTGKVSYVINLEVFDPAKKSISKDETPNDTVPHLGGARMPADLRIGTIPTQAPGKYTVRLTVTDRIAKDKPATIDVPFEIIAPKFGIVGVLAAGVGIPAQNYASEFALVNMKLDAANKCQVDITMQVLDAATKKPVMTPIVQNFPKDLPEGTDLQKENFLPMRFPLILNRPGRFIIEVNAQDKLGKTNAQLRFPLTVLDLNSL